MARDIQLAVAAAQLAVSDAGLADGGVDPTRIGIDLGAGLISSELDELAPAIVRAYEAGQDFDFQVWGRESIGMIEPIWLLKYLPNMLACHISILLDCQGPSNTITEADASANLAIAEATRIIARGRADVMIAGGADSQDPPAEPGPDGPAREHVPLEGGPAEACRPFDADRDGWVPGEGAGILILEEREHALARGEDLRRGAGRRVGLRRHARRRPRPGGDRHRGRHRRRAAGRRARAVRDRSRQRPRGGHAGLRPRRGTGLAPALRGRVASPSRRSRATWATWPRAAAPSS